MRAKVVVIGGGVMGTSAAMHLARRLDPIEEPVVLLEKSPRLASGSSGRSGAILRQHYADAPVARMARASLEEYAGFEARTGRDLGFRRTGVLTLAPAGPWAERIRRNVEMLRGIGVDTRLVDAAEMRELVRGIAVSDDAVGAWEPGGGFVDPVQTVEAFAAVARTHGATTRLGVGAEALAVEDGRIAGVRTAEGTIETGQVLLVAGPWTPGLLARSGIGVPLRAVRPEQHFVAMAPAPAVPPAALGPEPDLLDDELEGPLARIERETRERALSEVVPHPTVIDLEHGFYTRCEPALERTRVGRVDHDHDDELDDPDRLDEAVPDAFRRWARGALVARLPQYADRPDHGAEAAWYTLSPDSQALIGPLPGVRGLTIAAGFSGHGFKLAPSVGLGLSQMLLGDPVTAFDAAFFAPTRFSADPRWGTGAFGL